MVVDSPMPSMPSAQRTRMITRVWFCMVCMASLCGRMVGRSTMIVSIDSMAEESMSIPVRFLKFWDGFSYGFFPGSNIELVWIDTLKVYTTLDE
ncbi:hypothetical protein D3C84_431990 [compost metagenome]